MRVLRILYHVGMAIAFFVMMVGAFGPVIALVILGEGEMGQKWAVPMGLGMQFIAAVIADIMGHRSGNLFD